MRRAINSGESPAIPSNPVPQSQPPMPRLQGRFLLQFQRLALSWHALRNGRGRAVIAARRFRARPRRTTACASSTSRTSAAPAASASGINPQLDAVAAEIRRRHRLCAARGRRRSSMSGAGHRRVLRSGAPMPARASWRSSPIRWPSPAWSGTPASLPGVRIFPYALWKERANLRLHGTADTTESSLIEDGKANSRTGRRGGLAARPGAGHRRPAGHRLHEGRRRRRRAGDPGRRHRARCAARASSRSTSPRRTEAAEPAGARRDDPGIAELPAARARPQRHDPGAEHGDGRPVQ